MVIKPEDTKFQNVYTEQKRKIVRTREQRKKHFNKDPLQKK